MSLFSLENLHVEFNKAFTSSTYLGPTNRDPQKLEQRAQKHIRLIEVFRLAQQQIEEALQGNDPTLDQKIYHLQLLQADGINIYQRYETTTHTWRRWLLKSLARYMPDLFKSFLPSCFSNKMEQAEQETRQAFEDYRTFIQRKITDLQDQVISTLTAPQPEEKEMIKFGIQKLGNASLLKFDEKGIPIPIKKLQAYQGPLEMSGAVEPLHASESLTEFLQNNRLCRPSILVIKMSENQQFTTTFFRCMLQLREKVAKIQITGLQELNFNELAMSKAEQLTFMQHLQSFHFPDIQKIVFLEDKIK